MSYFVRRIYAGLLFHPEATHIHPLIGIIVLLLQFIALLFNSYYILLGLFLFVLLEIIIFRHFRSSFNIVTAILPFLFIFSLIIYFFGGFDHTLRIFLRIFIGALIFSFFFSTTNPSDLSRMLENLRIPQRLALLPTLVLTMVPRIAKDAEETIESLKIRGEITGKIWEWLPKTLAIFIASALYRSNFLAQALYFKGFNVRKRSHYKGVKMYSTDWIRIIIWTVILSALLLLFYWEKKGIIFMININ